MTVRKVDDDDKYTLYICLFIKSQREKEQEMLARSNIYI